MQNLDNSIDEIFIKAADEYTLKMPNDWDFIALQLKDDKKTLVKNLSPLKNTIILLTISLLSFIMVELKDSKPIVEGKNIVINTDILSTRIDMKSNLSSKPIINNSRFKITNSYPFKATKIIVQNSLLGSTFSRKSNKPILSKFSPSSNNNLLEQKFIIPKDNNNDSLKENNIYSNISVNNFETLSPNKEMGIENTSIISKKEKVNKVKNRITKRLYFGIQSGISYNQIKNQSFTKPGYNIGLITGFSLNNKWALELGLLLTKKSYFTSGQYFNDRKAASTMPAGMDIKSLEGNSTLIEVPLTMKYNFITKKDNKYFYINAGITTNIITNEHNNYLASINGGLLQHLEATYKNNDFKVLGGLNLGIGFENKVSNKINFRIQPYVQIPLNGIGIGALPVTTFGLQVGFTNNYFK